MSKFATKGDEIATLQARRDELIKENKQLNEQIAAVRNLQALQDKSKELGFVEINPKEVNYLKIEE